MELTVHTARVRVLARQVIYGNYTVEQMPEIYRNIVPQCVAELIATRSEYIRGVNRAYIINIIANQIILGNYTLEQMPEKYQQEIEDEMAKILIEEGK